MSDCIVCCCPLQLQPRSYNEFCRNPSVVAYQKRFADFQQDVHTIFSSKRFDSLFCSLKLLSFIGFDCLLLCTLSHHAARLVELNVSLSFFVWQCFFIQFILLFFPAPPLHYLEQLVGQIDFEQRNDGKPLTFEDIARLSKEISGRVAALSSH